MSAAQCEAPDGGAPQDPAAGDDARDGVGGDVRDAAADAAADERRRRRPEGDGRRRRRSESGSSSSDGRREKKGGKRRRKRRQCSSSSSASPSPSRRWRRGRSPRRKSASLRRKSPSPRRHGAAPSRRRSPGGGGRARSLSWSPPPALRRQMAHAAAQKTAKEANADNAGRFYDGYRWVDREDTLGGTATLGQRRVTIQNLPPEIDEPQLRAFLAAALGACGVAVPDDQPDLILSCWLSEERKCDRLGVLHVRPYKYAFVQLATVQSAETAIGLTGISCMGNTIKVESCSTDQTGLRTMAALAAGHVSQPGGDFDFAGLLVPGAAAALGMATGLRG